VFFLERKNQRTLPVAERGGVGDHAGATGTAVNMEKLLPLIALAIMTGAAAPSPEQQIRDAEKAVNDAYAANDLPTYFSFYAPDLRALYPEGPTTLPEYIKSWTATINGGARITSFIYKDMVVQVGPSGDAAVASYLATAQQRNADKTVTTENFNETDVWFKRDGAWKIVEIQYSELPDKK
jgi:ketosteroid isomerase-like protein